MSIVPIHPAPVHLPPPAAPPKAPAPDPFDAAPGSVPFQDFLRASNEVHRSAPHRRPEPTDTFERAPGRDPWAQPTDLGWPDIGDVPPATRPEPTERTDVRTVHRVMSPIGAMIDLTV
ncbi:MAG: hypothetical protein RIB60_02000 [Phycisphaerales bacterium]